MSDVANAVKGFRAKQKEVEFAREKFVELTRRSDDVRENLPRLERNVESVRAQREQVVDGFVMKECGEEELEKVNKALEKAEKTLENERLIYDAILRQIKKLESEFPGLHTQVQLAERKCWEEISLQFESEITDEIKEIVKTLIAIGCQLGKPYQFVLSNLFPNPSSGETQRIQGELREEYDLND